MNQADKSALTDPNPDKRSPLLHFSHPDSHIPLYETPESPSQPLSRRRIILIAVLGVLAAFAANGLERLGETAQTADIAWPWIAPFALLLACIALMPFIARHFWEHYYPHIAIALGLIVAAYYLFARQTPSLAKSLGEYLSFVFFLGALYIVSGGILIRVRRTATPSVNTALLLTGAIVANLFGTTGAAMLLIRPFLRNNHGHIRPFHVVFFIFLVANIGGALTPIGDPPLFLGYLRGVPFWWVLEHCWPMWAFAVGILLAVFFILDTLAHRHTPRVNRDPDLGPAISIYGAGNLLLILLILAGVLLNDHLVHLLHIPWRELIMVAAACLSLAVTPRRIHVENVFNFAPIREVAILFLGIFATMVPALDYLRTHAHDPRFAEHFNTPGQYYYTAGALTSTLDNAPTYLTFLEIQLGQLDRPVVQRLEQIARDPGKPPLTPDDTKDLTPQQARQLASAVSALQTHHGDRLRANALTPDQLRLGILLGDERLNAYLVAISLGAVFFGACTYIGNGPNFMVKSIADHAGIRMPTFFGYVGFFTLPILLPVLLLVAAIFLRR